MKRDAAEILAEVREKIEGLFEEYGVNNYVVIIDKGDITYSTHSVDEEKLFGIVGFMEMLKQDLIQKLKEVEVEIEEDEWGDMP